MNLQDPEALIQCPYEKVHMIRRKRMPYHLQKCRRNYSGRAYKVCPFNARHEVPEPEYQHHLVHCPNKCMVEKDMIHIKRLHEDAAYREKYEGVNNNINNSNSRIISFASGSTSPSAASDADSTSADLSRAFGRGLNLNKGRSPSSSPQPEYDWFDDDQSYTRQSEQPRQRQQQNLPEQIYQRDLGHKDRQPEFFDEKRAPSHSDEIVDTSDYGSDAFESGSSQPRTAYCAAVDASTMEPRTEPVALRMIKTFGRGSNVGDSRDGTGGRGSSVGYDDRSSIVLVPEHSHPWHNDAVDDGDSFGPRFPVSLGRGTSMSAPTSTVLGRAKTTMTIPNGDPMFGSNRAPTVNQSTLKSNVLSPLAETVGGSQVVADGQFDDSSPSPRSGSPSGKRIDSLGYGVESLDSRRDAANYHERKEACDMERQELQQRERQHQIHQQQLEYHRRQQEIRQQMHQQQIQRQQPQQIQQEQQYRQQQYQLFRQYQLQQHGQFTNDSDERADSPDSSSSPVRTFEERQIGDANFPEFQRGTKPRYSSTFCSDRPLSKQAQIQLAQQRQMEEDGRTNDNYLGRYLKRATVGKRGRGRGLKKFQFVPQQQEQPREQQQQEFDAWNERPPALGRGAMLGRGVSYD